MTDAATAPKGADKAKDKAKEPKVKAPTIGDAAIAAIRGGKSNDEALKAVQAAFPDAKTTLASINWYRNKLRTDGEKVPSARDLKAKVKAAKDAADKAAAKEAAKNAPPPKTDKKKAEEAKQQIAGDPTA